MYVKEQKHYADSAGTSTNSTKSSVQTQIEAISIGAHGLINAHIGTARRIWLGVDG